MSGRLMIRGAQVWDPAGDVHDPWVRDVLVEGALIHAVLPPGDPLTADWLAADPAPEVLEGAGRLLMPGFVNAHFHSYDALVKGLRSIPSRPISAAAAAPRSAPGRSLAPSNASSTASPPCRT
jgi:cytosine/adenosine deaminase-related metal-dependent hydrolase